MIYSGWLPPLVVIGWMILIVRIVGEVLQDLTKPPAAYGPKTKEHALPCRL